MVLSMKTVEGKGYSYPLPVLILSTSDIVQRQTHVSLLWLALVLNSYINISKLIFPHCVTLYQVHRLPSQASLAVRFLRHEIKKSQRAVWVCQKRLKLAN